MTLSRQGKPSAAEAHRLVSLLPCAGRVPAICLLALSLVAWAVAGCGYVVQKATPSWPTPTPTAAVELLIPSLRATPTLLPAPPLPTSTPTPTSTPIVHVVEKGDNLLAIAYEYGVDVQVIIEVTGV